MEDRIRRSQLDGKSFMATAASPSRKIYANDVPLVAMVPERVRGTDSVLPSGSVADLLFGNSPRTALPVFSTPELDSREECR